MRRELTDTPTSWTQTLADQGPQGRYYFVGDAKVILI
jgi:hypothetical protein